MLQNKAKSSFLRADYAIQQRVTQENKLYDADFYDKKMKLLGVNANWFEKNQKFEVLKNKRINDGRIRTELTLTNQEVKYRKKQRLLELYHAEAYL